VIGDPREILGVGADAGPEELKRAFRRQAMRWHPDRNAHPEAAERFKAIAAAYERLVAVDEPGEAESAEAAAEAGESGVERAPDIRMNLDLTLEEAARGCRKRVRYTRGSPCATCAGSGEAGLSRTRFCNPCHGSGRVRNGSRGLATCPDCGGRGFFSERICPDCGGSGREISDASLEIRVPAGMLPGDDLRLAGQGEPGDDEREPGDLYLTVVIRSHRLFRLQGRDIVYAMPVSALALLAGGTVEVAVVGGRAALELEPGPVAERVVRLAGKGFPGRGRLPPGDLVVTLQPVLPVRLGKKQRKALLDVDAALMEDAERALPDVAAWRQGYLPD
jgi:molecular chaperone DnaJ